MKNDDSDDTFVYPSANDILLLHRDIIEEDAEATSGVHDPDRIEFALSYIRDGHFGEVPETIHEKAFHLMRLLASNHWFTDGNKRTALNATELFYIANGYELEYGADIRSILKLFSVRESLIDQKVGPEYLKDQATEREPFEETDPLTALSIVVGAILIEYSDKDVEQYLPDEYGEESPRESFDLTMDYDGTVKRENNQEVNENGG